MAMNDAYKPAGATRPKPEPEIVPGMEPLNCGACGAPIQFGEPYRLWSGTRYHASESRQKCREAYFSQSAAVTRHRAGLSPEERAEYEKRDAAGRMTGAERGKRPETTDEAAALDRAGVVSPEARAAVLARADTRASADLDVLGSVVGLTRFVGEPDAIYRERLQKHTAPSRLRVYVAGASKELDRCRGAMKMIERAGGVITLDWVAAIEAEGLANEGLDNEKRQRYARADFEGVGSADLIWLLASPLASTGSWTELGIALALGKTIVVSGPARERSIFCSLATFETDHDLEALDYIREKISK